MWYPAVFFLRLAEELLNMCGCFHRSFGVSNFHVFPQSSDLRKPHFLNESQLCYKQRIPEFPSADFDTFNILIFLLA